MEVALNAFLNENGRSLHMTYYSIHGPMSLRKEAPE
jgi:hypothetical protein